MNKHQQSITAASLLQDYTHQRSYHFIQDANTFLWAKFQSPVALENQSRSEIYRQRVGGGNILVGGGLLTAITYLSKIFWLINDQDALKSASDKESQTFVYLIRHYDPERMIGLGGEDHLLRMFNIARHKIVHLLAGGGEDKNTVCMSASSVSDIRTLKRQV